nr:cytokine receptor-like factor 2 [Anolis sagrei ordinatus]
MRPTKAISPARAAWPGHAHPAPLRQWRKSSAQATLPELNDQEMKQCPQYIYDQGYTTGCVFQADHNALLNIYIKNTNGTKDLYNDEQNIYKYLKPNPPENVTLQWLNDEVIAQCMTPKYPSDFYFEFQYKSSFDKNWQVRGNESCEIKAQGFDPGKCYTFRFRLKYEERDYFSEWSAETHWTNGSSDSCSTDASEPNSNTVILLTSVLSGLLIIFVLLLCVCRLSRIRNTLIPIIPDPKHVYCEMFTDHNGDFQEWVSKTENLLTKTNLQRIEEECIIEEAKEADFQEIKAEA